MKKSYHKFLQSIDPAALMPQVRKLYALEYGQTFRDYHRAAEYIFTLLQEANIPNAQLLHFPADGKSVFQDKRMPLAWDASVGRLTLLDPELPASEAFFSDAAELSGPVVADYQKHPFHLIKGSVATAPGGQIVRIMTEAQFLAGEDPRGCLVMLEPLTWPRAKILTPILDQGALGFISDFLTGRYQTPDTLQWINACTEGPHWHIQCDDRPFIGFSVTPRTGDIIRYAASRGELRAKVECDGIRYAGDLPAVTALIPGKKEEEIWILAHPYEPLADDDTCGVIAAIETARQIMAAGTPEYSLRLVFAMEMYGFAAYAASLGNNLHRKVIGGVNFDTPLCTAGAILDLLPAGPSVPFYGNALLRIMHEEFAGYADDFKIKLEHYGSYIDDQLLSDSTVGIPTVWLVSYCKEKFWHNSEQTPDFLDEEFFAKGCALNTAFVYHLLNPVSELLDKSLPLALSHLQDERKRINENTNAPAERMRHLLRREKEMIQDFARFCSPEQISDALKKLDAAYQECSRDLAETIPHSLWRDYAEGMIPARIETGFPYDLAKLPARKRFPLPDNVIYGPFANVLSNMDGSKTLAQLIREAEYETGKELKDNEIKKYISALSSLADHGYLALQNRNELFCNDLVKALKELGVCQGDLLFVHSSLGAFGHIHGGASTIIQALIQAVGADGTLLFPTFTRPYIRLGDTLNKFYNYRPFDPADPGQIWTGTVPQVLLEKYPDAKRSRHITHSWAGLGALAEECLKDHEPCDPPVSLSSPFTKGVHYKGKVLHFGSGLNATTFLHYMEDILDLPYLDSAVCTIKKANGMAERVMIRKHLPGDRDFYRKDAENSKFFQAALKAGLEIKSITLGTGKLMLMDMNQLFEIGMKLLEKDPRILLCDDPQCLFCRRS